MNMIPGIWIAFFIAAFLVDWLLDILNIGHIMKNRHAVPDCFAGVIDNDTYAKSVRYSLRKAHFGLITSVQGRVILLIVYVSGAVSFLEGGLSGWNLPIYWHSLLFLTIAFFALQVVEIPASLYGKFVIEEEFGFNKSGIGLYLADKSKELIIGLIMLMALLGGLHLIMRWTGQLWWLVGWVFITGFQLIVTVLYPVLIAPLFNKFEPLKEGELRTKLEELASRCKFPVKGIYVMDGSRHSRHSNAYFSGIGRARRIVLYDTLIDQLPPEELAAILAHEIGHWKYGHIRRFLLLGMIVNLGLFALAGLAMQWPLLFQTFGFPRPSLHGIIFLAAFFTQPLTFFFSPLMFGISRRYEYAADGFAARHTDGPEAIKSALLSLNRDNLSNLTPHPVYSFWHASHPSLSERLAALESVET